MGIGTLEFLAVFLIAFIFLGPNRLVDLARLLGRASREAKRLTDDLPTMLLTDEKLSDDKTNEAVQGEDGVIRYEDSTNEPGPIAFKASNPPDPTSELKDTDTRE